MVAAFGGERAVTRRAVGSADACTRPEPVVHSDSGDIPGLRGGGDEHLAAGGADLAQGIPVDGRGGAAAGALRAVLRFVEVGLLDLDVLPIDVELVGDDHGEMGLDALADLGILGDDGDDAVGVNLTKARRYEVPAAGRGGLGEELRDADRLNVERPRACRRRQSGDAEERATVEGVLPSDGSRSEVAFIGPPCSCGCRLRPLG